MKQIIIIILAIAILGGVTYVWITRESGSQTTSAPEQQAEDDEISIQNTGVYVPNEQTKWQLGQTHEVRWSGLEPGTPPFYLHLMQPGGGPNGETRSWTEDPVNDIESGRQNIAVPSNTTPDDSYIVCLYQKGPYAFYGDAELYACSDQFSIVQ